MEAKDLRIGNYVTDAYWEHFKTVIEVDSVNEKGINLLIESETKHTYMEHHFINPCYEFDELHGIPLTEEWLLKFGFVLYGKEATDSESPRDWYWIKKGFQMSIDNITWRCSCIDNLDIQQVHQLQNLFFCLVGKELTIKP